MAQPLNRYRADLRDFRFALFEHFQIQRYLGEAPFTDWGVDEVNMVLDEMYRFACEVTGPYSQIGDQEGAKLVDGRVKTPTGYKEAWNKLWEAGWRTLTAPAAWGGQDAPNALGFLCEELLSGSNTAFAMYPGLSMGAAEVIGHFGTERQHKLYLAPLMNGAFSGTMCLTEPHAGSDVGSALTAAKPLGDGRYAIKGTKIFITAGDNDFVENTVHLVLARIDGAEAGTKGLSLFIVPRLRVGEDGAVGQANDVEVASLEHKMGINGSATCVMQFGDNDGCIGELVGTVEHQGMKQMFRMMNFARVGVGIQGLSVAGLAYLSAAQYATERKQGSSIHAFKDPNAQRVAIIEHPNIKKDLLDMKARVEGIRALMVKLAVHQDFVRTLQGKDDEAVAYHQGQVDLLTPILKAYATDQAFRVCERAIQVYGGAGFLHDHPVEQACRDSKIFSIYEGTNFIQSMDLIARKLGQASGANTLAFFKDVRTFINAQKEHAVFGSAIGVLNTALQAVEGGAMMLAMWSRSDQLVTIPVVAERFLELMSELVVGWLLLERGVIAVEKLQALKAGDPDYEFYQGKKYAALYFANDVLSFVPARCEQLTRADQSAMEISNEAFLSA